MTCVRIEAVGISFSGPAIFFSHALGVRIVLNAHAIGTVVIFPAHRDVDVRVLFPSGNVNATARVQTGARAERRRPVLSRECAHDEAPDAPTGVTAACRQLFVHTALITDALAFETAHPDGGQSRNCTAETDTARNTTRTPRTRTDVSFQSRLMRWLPRLNLPSEGLFEVFALGVSPWVLQPPRSYEVDTAGAHLCIVASGVPLGIVLQIPKRQCGKPGFTDILVLNRARAATATCQRRMLPRACQRKDGRRLSWQHPS